MLGTDIFDIETAFGCFRKRLAFVIARRMNPLLAMRLSADDVLQETFLSVLKRCDFIRSDPDVPIYFKFRKIALQTLADLERTHIQYQRRSQLKEVSGENADKAFCILPADIPTPRSVLARKERHALLRQIVNDLLQSGELPPQNRLHSIYGPSQVGTFKFCMLRKSVPSKTVLSTFDERILRAKYAIRRIAGSREKWYGLDTSSLLVESVPLTVGSGNTKLLERKR